MYFMTLRDLKLHAESSEIECAHTAAATATLFMLKLRVESHCVESGVPLAVLGKERAKKKQSVQAGYIRGA
jgi:hypothetical protein